MTAPKEAPYVRMTHIYDPQKNTLTTSEIIVILKHKLVSFSLFFRRPHSWDYSTLDGTVITRRDIQMSRLFM